MKAIAGVARTHGSVDLLADEDPESRRRTLFHAYLHALLDRPRDPHQRRPATPPFSKTAILEWLTTLANTMRHARTSDIFLSGPWLPPAVRTRVERIGITLSIAFTMLVLGLPVGYLLPEVMPLARATMQWGWTPTHLVAAAPIVLCIADSPARPDVPSASP